MRLTGGLQVACAMYAVVATAGEQKPTGNLRPSPVSEIMSGIEGPQTEARELQIVGPDPGQEPGREILCESIRTSEWWSKRKERKDPLFTSVIDMDKECEAFHNNVKGCKLGTATARCEIVGAHSKLCRSNPCNNLSDGTCSIARTHGECVWFTPEWGKLFNAYWKKKENKARPYAKPLLGGTQGCFRNPCNMAGFGRPEKPQKTCNGLSVPGLYECSWCKIPGEGMGCQMTAIWSTTTNEKVKTVHGPTAKCAPHKDVPKGFLYTLGAVVYGEWKPIDKGNCQCDIRFPICYRNVNKLDSPDGPEVYKLA